MKSRLILMIAGWVALTPGMGHAAAQPSSSGNPAKATSNQRQARPGTPAGSRNRQTHGGVSAATPGHRTPQKNHPASHPSPTRATRPKQPSRSGQRSRSGNTMAFHQPGPSRPAAATSNGLIHNQTGNRTLPVRSPARGSGRPSNYLRYRGPNPAVIGGPASSNAKNTAALNGTHMGRRP